MLSTDQVAVFAGTLADVEVSVDLDLYGVADLCHDVSLPRF